jgi:hypothetical protein
VRRFLVVGALSMIIRGYLTRVLSSESKPTVLVRVGIIKVSEGLAGYNLTEIMCKYYDTCGMERS